MFGLLPNTDKSLQIGGNVEALQQDGSGNLKIIIVAGGAVIGHVIVDSGSLIANAGTNLNTSALALESGGNLAAILLDTADIETNTANIPPIGQTTMAGSTPVAIASNQSAIPVTASAGTNLNTSGLALESGGNLAAILLDTADIETNTGNIPPLGQAAMASSTPVVIASNQTAIPENLTQVLGSALGNTNPIPTQFISQSGYVALTAPPANTTGGADTSFTFGSQVNTVILQNNTGAVVNYAFDSTSSAGSLALAAGQTLIYSKKVTVVHLFTAANQNVNGTSASNIVLLGEL